jgi:hypothetical protein
LAIARIGLGRRKYVDYIGRFEVYGSLLIGVYHSVWHTSAPNSFTLKMEEDPKGHHLSNPQQEILKTYVFEITAIIVKQLRFEVVTVATVKIAAFWEVLMCSHAEMY